MSANRVSSHTNKAPSASQQRNRSAPLVAFTITGQTSRENSSGVNNEDQKDRKNEIKSEKSSSTPMTQGSHISFESVTSAENNLTNRTIAMESTLTKEEFDKLTIVKKTDELFAIVHALLPHCQQIHSIQR